MRLPVELMQWLDGWAYTDDSWQNPAMVAMTEGDIPGGPGEKGMPGMALKRITRRRKWWRRVYLRGSSLDA